MDASVDNMVDFTGVLVGRHWRPGQKYIQLVFKTTEGLRLSLSRNLQMVRSLSMGNTYQVKGPEYVLGEKIFIKEPNATLVEHKASFWNKRNIIILFVISIATLCIAGFLLTSMHGSANHSQAGGNTPSTQAQQKIDSDSSGLQPTDTTQEPGPSAENQPSQAPAAGNTTKKSTAAKTGTSAAITQPSPSPAPEPAPSDTQQSPDPTPPATPDPAPAPDPPADPGTPDPSQTEP